MCDELKEQGVVAVRRVTLKKGDTVTPTNTIFLTFNKPDLPKALRIGYMQVNVDLFVPNPLQCFGCNNRTSSATRATNAELDQNVYAAENKRTREIVRDHRCSPIVIVCTPPQPKIALSGRRKRRVSEFALKSLHGSALHAGGGHPVLLTPDRRPGIF